MLRQPIELAQYCSIDYQAVLRKHDLLISMSGKGNCYDNAVVETFFKTIKSELIWPVAWQTRCQAENAVARYIDGFYNPDPAALDARLPEPGPVRDGWPGVSNKLSTKPGQVHNGVAERFNRTLKEQIVSMACIYRNIEELRNADPRLRRTVQCPVARREERSYLSPAQARQRVGPRDVTQARRMPHKLVSKEPECDTTGRLLASG